MNVFLSGIGMEGKMLEKILDQEEWLPGTISEKVFKKNKKLYKRLASGTAFEKKLY